MRSRKLLIVTVAALIVIDIASIKGIWSEVENKRPDFFDLYGTGQLFSNTGVPAYDFHPTTGSIEASEPRRIDNLHPPFEILIFVGLSHLPPAKAYVVWAGCNLLMLWCVPLLLWNSLPELHADFHYVTIFFGSFLFVFVALVQGQDSILLLLLMAGAFRLLEKHPVAAGIVLGLGMFKFFLVVPLVLALAITTGKRILQGWAFSSLALLALSIAVVGFGHTERYYLSLAHFAATPTTKIAASAGAMPNLRGLISLVFPQLVNTTWGIVLPAIFSLLILIVMFVWALRNRSAPLPLRYAVFVLFCTIASFHFFLHNAVILLIPLLLAANEFARQEADQHLKIAFAAAAISTYAFPNILPMGVGVPVIAISSVVICIALLLEVRQSEFAGRAHLSQDRSRIL